MEQTAAAFNSLLGATPLGGYGLAGVGVAFVVMIIFRTIISQGVRGVIGHFTGRGKTRRQPQPYNNQQPPPYYPPQGQTPYGTPPAYDQRAQRRARRQWMRQNQQQYPAYPPAAPPQQPPPAPVQEYPQNPAGMQ